MLKGKIKLSDYRDILYDKYNNKINNYILEEYYKNADEEWILRETIYTHLSNCFVINNKPYYESNGLLIPINTDSKSEKYGVYCRVVSKDTTEYIKIVKQEYLCKNDYLSLRLCKTDYSDGSCYYTLINEFDNFPLNYGNKDLSKLVKVLEEEIKNSQLFVYEGNTKVNQAIEKLNNQRQIFINNIRQFVIQEESA